MSVRAAVVIAEDHDVCLIHRDRDGLTYSLLPGGSTDPGETPAEAAAREALEELDLLPVDAAVSEAWTLLPVALCDVDRRTDFDVVRA